MSGSDWAINPVVGLLLAYLAGSLPFAFLAGKSRGVDLRRHGSGNLGATNVVRVLGPRIGAAVFVADALKGFLPAFFLPAHVASSYPQLWALAFGIAAIVGHVRPVFLLFRTGGKGVATAAGVFLALAWMPTLLAAVLWAVVFGATRYVSLASLAAASFLPLGMLLTGMDPRSPVFVASVAVAVFVFWTHRVNITRLRRGEEHSFRRAGSGA